MPGHVDLTLLDGVQTPVDERRVETGARAGHGVIPYLVLNHGGTWAMPPWVTLAAPPQVHHPHPRVHRPHTACAGHQTRSVLWALKEECVTLKLALKSF